MKKPFLKPKRCSVGFKTFFDQWDVLIAVLLVYLAWRYQPAPKEIKLHGAITTTTMWDYTVSPTAQVIFAEWQTNQFRIPQSTLRTQSVAEHYNLPQK